MQAPATGFGSLPVTVDKTDIEGLIVRVTSGASVRGHITLEGADRQLLSETAAMIRELRPPEPYKGKGVKYAEETIRRKAGKAAGTTGAG